MGIYFWNLLGSVVREPYISYCFEVLTTLSDVVTIGRLRCFKADYANLLYEL